MVTASPAQQPRRLRLRPDVAVGEDQALADHVLGLDVGRAALRREVNDDALALDLPGDLPFLPVLVGAADEGLASVDRDLARAAGMGRVIPGARNADFRDFTAAAAGLKGALRPYEGAAVGDGLLATRGTERVGTLRRYSCRPGFLRLFRS